MITTKMLTSSTLQGQVNMAFRISTRALRSLNAGVRIPVVQQRSFATSKSVRNDNDDYMKIPVVNPADKYNEVSVDIHNYGQYLISALPKFIQQFSYVSKRSLLITVSGKMS